MTEPTFFLIVIDEDKQQFTVEGPMNNDEAWTRAIDKARDDGRKVRSCDIGSTSRADAIAEWQRHYGHFYRYVGSGNIVSPQSRAREKQSGRLRWAQ